MNKIIDYDQLKDNYILVDVRSPGEYEECHIPGAVNVPLFSNSQREMIGTVYKQESVEKAKKLGIEMVSQSLPEIYEKFCQLKANHKSIIVYCARGGMRSGSICGLLSSLGMNTWQLRGGYKGYRAIVNQQLPKINEQVNYIVLHGFTGVGKTEILRRLSKKGLDILDLEDAANHRGSLLGDVGLRGKRSQKQFESLIFEKLRNRRTNSIFVEAESKRIGTVFVPDYIKNKMLQGKHILVEADIEIRAERIIKEYISGSESKVEIVGGLRKLTKYMSNKKVEELVCRTEEGDYTGVVIELMKLYYDPMYKHSQDGYKFDLVVNANLMDDACNKIESWVNS